MLLQGQSTTIRTLIMHAMAEWYMRGEHHDQTRLSRILDVAQDLKVVRTHRLLTLLTVYSKFKNNRYFNRYNIEVQ